MTSLGVFAVSLVLGVAPSGVAPGAVPAAMLHAQLEESNPSDGETLVSAPSQVTLAFSGLIEERGAAMVLLGPDGSSWVLDPTRSPEDPRVLSGAAPALPAGGFRLEWRVISLDGHPVSGDIVFFVGEPVAGEPAFQAPAPSVDSPGSMEGAMDTAGGAAHTMPPLGIVVRTVVDFALLGLAGLLLFARLGGDAGERRGERTATALAVVGAVSASCYGWIWAGEVLGAGVDVGGRVSGLFDLVSGRPLGVEIGMAWLVVWALLIARRGSLAAVFAFLAVAAGAFGGHPASYSPALAVPTNGVHLIASAVWLGGLLALVTEVGSEAFRPLARRVSSLALVAALAVALTGLVQAWLFLDSPEQLWSTSYGVLVLAKIAGFLTLIGFGAYHRFRLIPALDSGGDGAPLAASVRIELSVAAAVVLIAAIVAHVPPNP